ncbi:MAG TPA: ATP-dependent DNA helicase [Chloroflexia bacterium]|nr:ATP-dependent DNA helicase [Chloroflexia bacterium]
MNWEDMPALLERLAALWPGYRPRPGQQQMARAVGHAMDSGLNLLVEGGTGVGKSVAYLLPAVLSALDDDKRTLIATSHKHLQDQLSEKDLPRLAELARDLGYPGIAWTTLKGLPNYLCRVAADTEAAREDPHPLLPPITEWMADDGHHGEFDELPFAIPADLRGRLSTEAEECPHERCPRYHDCFAMAATRRAKAAPLVITNHALLALHVAAGSRLLPGPFANVIVDEAHAFEDAATRAYGFECSSFTLRRLLYHEITGRMASRELLREAQAALARLDLEVAGLLGRAAGGPVLQQLALAGDDPMPTAGSHLDIEAVPGPALSAGGQTRATLDVPLAAGRDLADLLDRLATDLDPERRILSDSYPYESSPFDLDSETLEKLTETETAALRASKRAASLADRLHTISSADDPLLVYYVEQVGSAGAGLPAYTLLALPLEVGPFLESWWEEQATILTSATLSDGQSFQFFSERLGLTGPRKLMVPSPFDYPRRTRLVVTPVPGQEKADEAYYGRLADQIARLMDAAGGKCLLLFTSHRALDAVWSRLSVMRIAGWRLYRQGDGTQGQLMAAMRSAGPEDRLAMFASRSWWQGVDLPGMRLVVMDKLPFPQLGDPLVAARNGQIEAVEGHAFRLYMLPLALIAFRQGFGRLMRTERDFGAVAVCDARLTTRQYGARFLEALPEGIPVLGSSDELRAWVRQMEAGQVVPARPATGKTTGGLHGPPVED